MLGLASGPGGQAGFQDRKKFHAVKAPRPRINIRSTCKGRKMPHHNMHPTVGRESNFERNVVFGNEYPKISPLRNTQLPTFARKCTCCGC